MNRDDPPSLHHWLSHVTRSLPENAAQTITAEITNHFLDAVDDYMAEGLPKEAAQTRALADLGTAETINRGLKDVYHGQRLYKIGAVASMSILAILIFIPGLVYNLWAGNTLAIQISNIIVGFVLACLTAYVLDTLRRLLIWRFGMLAIDRTFKVAIACYLLGLVADIISLAIYNADGPDWIGDNRFFDFLVVVAGRGQSVWRWQIIGCLPGCHGGSHWTVGICG
ncbi:MAG: permease prefix domain 1-containing protein [Anaerolineae bacterium]